MDDSAFHEGEQAMQALCGVRERVEAAGRLVIRDHMPDQHRELFERLPTLLVATLDDGGQPWATMLAGPPGFVQTPDMRIMRVHARPDIDDPVGRGLRPGAAIGLLGLEPHTRRRNRMNGSVSGLDQVGFEVAVSQSFGNCPKYIQARRAAPQMDRCPGKVLSEFSVLSEPARRLVRQSDTLFIASSSGPVVSRTGQAGSGVDVSHRGGRPGFVRLQSTAQGDRLTLPDFVGNFLFNTLGNLWSWPKAGLLFVDWSAGHMLQLAATAQIEHEGPALADHPGAQRLLHLDVIGGVWRPSALALSWSEPELAPQLREVPPSPARPVDAGR